MMSVTLKINSEPSPPHGGAGRESTESPAVTTAEKTVSFLAQKSALRAFNSAYSNVSSEGKEAFRRGIQLDLEAELIGFFRMPELDGKLLAKSFAETISTDPSIYDTEGLCVGYAYLFGAHLLSKVSHDMSPETLLESFSLDERIHQAAHLSFIARYPVHAFFKRDSTGNFIKDSEGKVCLQSITAERCSISGMDLRHKWAVSTMGPLFWVDIVKEIHGVCGKAFMTVAQSESDKRSQLEIEKTVDETWEKFYGKDMVAEILKVCTENDASPVIATIAKDRKHLAHAITLYASKDRASYLLFDSNFGAFSFESLEELATKVKTIADFYGFPHLQHICVLHMRKEAAS